MSIGLWQNAGIFSSGSYLSLYGKIYLSPLQLLWIFPVHLWHENFYIYFRTFWHSEQDTLFSNVFSNLFELVLKTFKLDIFTSWQHFLSRTLVSTTEFCLKIKVTCKMNTNCMSQNVGRHLQLLRRLCDAASMTNLHMWLRTQRAGWTDMCKDADLKYSTWD